MPGMISIEASPPPLLIGCWPCQAASERKRSRYFRDRLSRSVQNQMASSTCRFPRGTAPSPRTVCPLASSSPQLGNCQIARDVYRCVQRPARARIPGLAPGYAFLLWWELGGSHHRNGGGVGGQLSFPPHSEQCLVLSFQASISDPQHLDSAMVFTSTRSGAGLLVGACCPGSDSPSEQAEVAARRRDCRRRPHRCGCRQGGPVRAVGGGQRWRVPGAGNAMACCPRVAPRHLDDP